MAKPASCRVWHLSLLLTYRWTPPWNWRSTTFDNISHIIGSFPFGKGSFLFAGVCIGDEAPAIEKVVVAIKGWADYEACGRKP
jgi:hypothetical protein